MWELVLHIRMEAEDWRWSSSPADIYLRTELRRSGQPLKCSRRVWRTTAEAATSLPHYIYSAFVSERRKKMPDWIKNVLCGREAIYCSSNTVLQRPLVGKVDKSLSYCININASLSHLSREIWQTHLNSLTYNFSYPD